MTYLPSFSINKSKVFHLTTLSLALALAGCGGGGNTVDSIAPKPDVGVVKNPSTGSENSAVADVDIYISFAKNELKTGNDKTKAQIRVTDKNGGILSGIPVEMSIEDAAKYGLSLSGASKQTTDVNGMVEVEIIQSSANLDSQINHKTQFKVEVPLEGGKTAVQSMPIEVTGTQIDNVSATVGVIGKAENFGIQGVVIDGSGQPLNNATVTLYNNDKVVDTVKTDNKGKFVFNTNSSLLTAVRDNYIFSIGIQGSDGDQQLVPNIIELPSISSVNISFPKIPDIVLTELRKVIINVPNAKNGDIVDISTSKGLIYTGTQAGLSGSTSQKFTVNNRQVVFYIRSEAPGSAIVTANYGQNTKATNVYFVSTNPKKLLLQVEEAVLATGSTTPVIARVLDDKDAPVKNAIVQFSLISDASAGKLSQGFAYTDESGVARVEYSSGGNPTSIDGVRIQAEVKAVRLPGGQEQSVNPLVTSSTLSVNTRSSYVSVALADKIESSENNVFYTRQGSMIVLDSAGQPAANQKVTLSLTPNKYGRGAFTIETPTTSSGGSGEAHWVQKSVECNSEDKNRNNILDTGEDTNGNGQLDPILAATILQNGQEVATPTGAGTSNGAKKAEFTTDATGKVDFAIRYPKEHAQWINAIITVNTRVDGSEARNSRMVYFPVLVDDVDLTQGIRPNTYSPFGTTLSCTAP